MYQKLLEETYVWSKLDHKNVIKLLGLTAAFDHTISIVSPLMSRGNTFDYVQDSGVDPRPLACGMTNGLHYLHTYKEGPIVHGDIKGLNVLVTEEGKALLTDFGLSFLTNSSFSMSTPGHTGGSLPWMAPELFEVQYEPTAAQDVWAFAMTALVIFPPICARRLVAEFLQELFTREDPFYPLRGAVIMRKIMVGPPDRPSAENTCSRLTDEWWGICSKCWHSDPSMRPTMLQVAKKIEQIVCSSFVTRLSITD
ncbi:hypothetical protein SCLCIDRAFT_105575 [Scleroderma citrinum Foug A]|uniref:Protein kinase domain-containing protein n=1 Tax=Scleroderma citrinum Foug A TaxID=1036808 RepID=A0A0C3EJQ1_9AGAM|nr:hypothetical protein SCLCIDRAFT_105575 [Scleroderma citrinum Foug A]